MKMPEYDLIVSAGRMICSATGIDGPGAVAVRGDRVVEVGLELQGAARQRLDFPDAVLLPGLVDFHAHPARGGSKYGVDPDLYFLPRGVTTVLSQGDAGALNWDAYRIAVLRNSQTRIRMALNLSARGESMPEGCFENLDDVDVESCVKAVEDGADDIWGIAVNVSEIACGATDPKEVLRRGLEAARRTGKPILYGVRRPTQWPYQDQLSWLRPGDVVTYCFRGGDWSIVDGRGKVLSALRAARDRGVLFDVGHGTTAFAFATAEAAVADGFPPDTISSDFWTRHLGEDPNHDLARTVSKMIAAGMPEKDAFAAATIRPAKLLGLSPEIGVLAKGSCADLAVLRFNPSAPLQDHAGTKRGAGWWEAIVTVRAGIVTPAAHR